MGRWKVQVYLYDLSHGMAKTMSMGFIGKQIDGIWHTGIVAFGYEYYYGGGIQASKPGQSMAGTPTEIIDIGNTDISQQDFHEWLKGVSGRFTPETYSLLSHNCNNFSDEACQFLTGQPIPSYITGLPEEALNTPMGQMFKPMIMQMEQQMKQGVGQLGGSAIPWQETGASGFLMLPTLDSRYAADSSFSDAFPPRSNSQTQQQLPQQQASQEVKQEQSSGSSSNAMAQLATAMAAAAASSFTGHKHESMKFKCLSWSNLPMLSVDTKYSSFFMLIKTASKKLASSSPELALSPEDIKVLTQTVDQLKKEDAGTTQWPAEIFSVFSRLISTWPVTSVFPVLGLFRLVLARPSVIKVYRDGDTEQLKGLLQKMTQCVPEPQQDGSVPEAAQVMALCALCNLFADSTTAKSISDGPLIMPTAHRALNSPKHTVRMMGATVLYNLALVPSINKDSDNVIEAVSMCAEVLSKETHTEVCHRVLLAMGQLCYCNDDTSMLLSCLDVNPQKISAKFPISGADADTCGKIANLCADLTTIMSVMGEDQEEFEPVD